MSKVYETGHAKNVANFETLISFVSGYGAAYNPSLASIKLNALQAKAAAANAVMKQVNELLAATNNAIGARAIAFEPLKKLSTKIGNALKATDTIAPIIANMETLNRKMQGKRATAKTTTEANALQSPATQISVAQLSFDNLLDTFQKQIELLNSLPQYAPNEPELQVGTLQALYTSLKTLNVAVVANQTNTSNGRLARNEIMYHPETGLIANAADTKNYVKSVFGTSSPQFKQISALSFKTIPL